MKKEWIIFLLIFSVIVFSSFINAGTGSPLTGGTITGELTNANVAVSITITIGEPSLTIVIPKNNTYITSKNLQLNFTSEEIQTTWYNLDNQANTTITGNTTFNTTQGQHTLYLYGNNSDGNETSANITFTVNSNKFKVYYEEYVGSNKGISTDFNKSSYEDLQSLSNIILENTNYGKMQFNEVINITNDANISDEECDLNTNTNISLNRIEVNATALPNFNKPATIWLYNLPFNNPRILMNGEICSAAICIFESFEGNILKFNVTQFSIFSAEETPATETVTGEGGGGGVTIRKFTIDKKSIKISLKQGETSYEEITIKNTDHSIFSFTISTPGIEEFVKISEKEFNLAPGEKKTIKLDFIAREEIIPELYIGNLIVQSGSTEKSIPIAIEIESSEPLFDIKLEIPRQFKRVLPGENVVAEIELYNLGDLERVDVNMDYIIKEEGTGKVILFEQDSLAVETQISFIKSFEIPEDTKYGNYIFYTRVNYNEKVASASDRFKVGEESLFLKYAKINLILLIIVLLLVYMIKRITKKKKR